MRVHLLLLLLAITAGTLCLCGSDSCLKEVNGLREKEKLLRNHLQKQEVSLQELQLFSQPRIAEKSNANPKQGIQYADCAQLFSSGSKTSGLHTISPTGGLSTLKVYCDMSDGGGWTVVQRRINGSESFNRSWTEYKYGFGNMEAEFWLGNDNLHHITAQGNYSLRINLEDFDGNQRYAEYKNFKVADEKDQYRLSFGGYLGTAGDALSGNFMLGILEWASLQGIKFSTFDQDNDNYQGNCAKEDNGGWWFNKCHSAHLNGLYYPRGHYSASSDNGIIWYPWRGWWYSLKTTIMKLRPNDFQKDSLKELTKMNCCPPS